MAKTCPTCGSEIRDKVDEDAERGGALTYAATGRALGFSTTWVQSRIADGTLTTRRVAGRTYVDGTSVRKVQWEMRSWSEDERRLDELNAMGMAGLCGTLGAERNAIAQRLQERHNAGMQERGLEPLAPSMPSSLQEALARDGDFAAQLVRKYSGG